MGGGGSYYDRDVTASSRRTDRGFSDIAGQKMSRREIDAAILPKARRIVSTSKSPLAYAFDDTGSMKNLPKIIWDKWPMMAGQIVMQKYLKDPSVSLAAIGDVTCDKAPLQICDFASIRDLDGWLEKLWLEGGGGGQHFESYEFVAYYYARLYEMQNAETPILIFTGDEAFRDRMSADELRKHFGGQHQDVDAKTIFAELKEKFQGNVFLIHRFYDGFGLDPEIVSMWEDVLGKECVIRLKSDLAIADVTLGVIAIASGARTLAGYIKDIKNRPLEMGGVKYEPQGDERIEEVRSTLKLFASFCASRSGKSAQKTASSPSGSKKPGENPGAKEWKL